MLNFVKCFFCIYWDNYIIFIFHFVNVVCHSGLYILSCPCIPGINPTWSFCMILLMYSCTSLLIFCWGFLHLFSSGIVTCNFLFELTRWKRLWCWEGLGAGAEGDDRGWDGWMASPTRWTRVWVNAGNWWWTGRPGVLQFMGSQRVGHDWPTELNWTEFFLIWFWHEGIAGLVKLVQEFRTSYIFWKTLKTGIHSSLNVG